MSELNKLNLDPEQLRVIRLYEMGRRLLETSHTDGYKDILDIFESMVETAEAELLQYNPTKRGGDANEARAFLHARAFSLREAFHQFQQTITIAITESQQTPDKLTQTVLDDEYSGADF